MINGANTNLNVPDSNWLYVIGRIKPGVSPQALQAKMSTSLRQWLSTQPTYTQNGGSTIIPKQHVVITPGGAGIQNLQMETGKGLYLLMAISGLVLLVACANAWPTCCSRAAQPAGLKPPSAWRSVRHANGWCGRCSLKAFFWHAWAAWQGWR